MIRRSSLVLAFVLLLALPHFAMGYSQGDYYAEGSYYAQSYYEGGYWGGSSGGAAGKLSQTFTTPGSQIFTVPAGVTQLNVVAVGGGGGGGAGSGGWGSGGGGGCGGGIAGGTISVSPGQQISFYVGYGGGGGNGAQQCSYSGDPSCGSYYGGSNGSTGGASAFSWVYAEGGGWGRTGFYNLWNSYSGGAGGGSSGGGGGNGWPGYYAVPGNGGTQGSQTNSQGAGGYCTGNGWGIYPGSYITKASWSPGVGGRVPGGYTYWGGGGGGGLVINGSGVAGQDGQSSPGSGGQGYGGGGGGSNLDNQGVGGAGASGVVYVEWTAPPASCTVSISPNPATYSNSATATLTWTSSSADSYTHINNAGNFTGSGGTIQVPRTATTDYSCTAYGTGGSDGAHAYTLTINPATTPTASITSSLGNTIQLGQSSTITATFTAAGGDTLTHDNIDGDAGNPAGWTGGLGADTDPVTPKSITFTPSSAGTYTFYARAQTSYFTSWATYNTLAITVQAPCTLNGTTIQSGDSATFYSQQLAPSGRLCSSVSQTRTCTNGVLSGSDSYQYSSCTCAPLYSCSGSNVTFTDNSCSVTTVASCVSPAFCSAGISSCQLPAPSFNAGAGTTGHIQAKPQVLSPGKSAVVSWNLSNVSACSVSGSNGDSWTGASGSKTTSPISQRTVFTLSCTGLDASKVSETAVVNVTPTFQEQ